jgi:O-acetyl-ADP-ribose deacetylase (regulator of RNase III)
MRHRPSSLSMAVCSLVDGDLLDQPVDAIVNAWNRNLIPWWLLLPQGVSGAIKKRGGIAPFRQLRKLGVLPLGGAALTSAGRLPFRAIIHVAAIGHLWRASEPSIRLSVTNALRIASEASLSSLAFPVLGSGSGGFPREQAIDVMLDQIALIDTIARIMIVRFKK